MSLSGNVICKDDGDLPLPALLSQAFVAFTIEFDNEFEHRAPHRTTNHGSTPGYAHAPWLVSMAMWTKYLRHIPEDGIAVGELQRLTGVSNEGLHTWLTRLGKWWGYLLVQPALTGSASKRLSADAIVYPTPGGRRAIEAWRPLTPLIEERWRERFGNQTMDRLRKALVAVGERLDPETPDSFSILEYDTPKTKAARRQLPAACPATDLALPQLLAKVLLAFALEFDRDAPAPLAVSANLLRLTGDDGVRVRDLPRLAWLAKMGVEDVLRMAKRHRLAAVTTDGASRTKLLVLTEKGRQARDANRQHARNIEEDWQRRFGVDAIALLRCTMEELAVGSAGERCPLLRGLVPYADGWRASLPPLEGLPHFPVVSHRGGFPDGS